MLEGIDAAIRPLIEVMNRVPYIETFSCCEGHPEESAVKHYGYAVATVIFEIKDELQNLASWLLLAQKILQERKKITLKEEFAFIIEKKYSLSENNNLGWLWEIKIQATAKTPQDCRQGLDEGIAFITKIFVKEAEKHK